MLITQGSLVRVQPCPPYVSWGYSSVGRALPSQGRGRGFESLYLHHDFDARRDPARFLYHHLPGQIRREARNPWVVHHHLIPLRFLLTTSVNSAQGVAMLKETLVKRAFVELQAPFVWLVLRYTFGRSLPSRARPDQAQFSSQVARSDACSARITRSRKKVLASQSQLSA